MRSSTFTALVLGAASVQAITPLDLTYLEALLTPTCLSTLTTTIASNSTFSQCLQLPNLLPALSNNATSIIPDINFYLNSICSSPACNATTIDNVTASILSGCATDLANFGISNSTVEIVFGAYDTAREVVCLADNSTIPINSTLAANSTSNSTLCPIESLELFQAYIGEPLTNDWILTTILGGNSTTYNEILAVVHNVTLLRKAACTNCVAAAVDIVLQDYPTLGLLPIDISSIANASSYSLVPLNSTKLTFPEIYKDVCGIAVGGNVTLPKNITEGAVNKTLAARSLLTNVRISDRGANAAAEAMKRFAKWD